MKKPVKFLLLVAALSSLASCSCSSKGNKKQCGSDGVCRIGDMKRNPSQANYII